MYQQDWLMRQIEMAIQFIVKVVFGKDLLDEDVGSLAAISAEGELPGKLRLLIANGEFGRAEDLLFESLEPGNMDMLRLAIAFYSRLNELEDKVLDAGDFSREEVRDGLSDAMELYGINLMELFEME